MENNIEDQSGNPFDLPSNIVEKTNNIIHRKPETIPSNKVDFYYEAINKADFDYANIIESDFDYDGTEGDFDEDINENLIETESTHPDFEVSDNEEPKNVQAYFESNKPIKKSDIKVINGEIQDQSDNPFENDLHIQKTPKRKM